MFSRAFSTATATTRFGNHGQYQQELIRMYQRKTCNLFLCINNPRLAERVCQVIGDQLNGGNNRVLFEASPGNGILTERLLLDAPHVKRVRVFENNEGPLKRLAELQQRFGESRLEIVDRQILGKRCSSRW